MENSTMNAFDFTDLSDVSEELQAKMAPRRAEGTQGKIDEVVSVFTQAAVAGLMIMSISQLEVVCAPTRLNVELPSVATVRKYLNAAVADGVLIKASRQTYALASSGVEAWVPGEGETDVEDEAAVEVPDVADELDDLADL